MLNDGDLFCARNFTKDFIYTILHTTILKGREYIFLLWKKEPKIREFR